MKKALRIVLLLAIVGGLAGGGYWLLSRRAAAAASTTTGDTLTQIVTVQEGTLNATLSVVGSLEAVQSADVTFQDMAGTAELLSLDVQAGQVVTAGQALAAIDPAAYRQTLDQAQSDLEAAREKLADLTAPPTALETAQASVAVTSAQVDLQAAQDALDELEHPDITALQAAVTNARLALAQAKADLLSLQQDTSDDDNLARLREADAEAYAVYADWAGKTHSDTDREYHLQLTLVYNKMMDAQDALKNAELQAELTLLRSQIAVRQDEQALARAQEALADARSGGDKLRLAQARLAVARSEVALRAARQDAADLQAGASAAGIAAARAEVDRLTLAVADAQAALDGAVLVAPFGGTVLDTYVSPGDALGASTPVLTLANLQSFQVVAAVDETTIRQVSAGQAAAVTLDAFPGQTFKATVLSVPLQGTLQGDVTVYEVPLSLEGTQALDLKVGMTANVDISVGQAANALLVPTLALIRSSGSYQVQVPNTTDPAGDPETVPVQIGLSDGTYTQILKGLNAGDQVIVEYASSSEQDQLGIPGGPGGVVISGGGPAGTFEFAAPPGAGPSFSGGTRP